MSTNPSYETLLLEKKGKLSVNTEHGKDECDQYSNARRK
jgi:hypothetical protein